MEKPKTYGTINDAYFSSSQCYLNSSDTEDSHIDSVTDMEGERESSICKASEISALLEKYRDIRQYANHRSLLIILFCSFVSEMSRGMLLPTLFLLINSLGGTYVHLGLAMFSFDVGRVVSSPIFSYISDAVGHRKTLIASLTLMTMGYLIYTNFYMFGSGIYSVDTIIGGLFVIGLGAGT